MDRRTIWALAIGLLLWVPPAVSQEPAREAGRQDRLDERVVALGGFGAYRGGMSGSSWEDLEAGVGGEVNVRMVSRSVHSLGAAVIVTAHDFVGEEDRGGTILEFVGDYRVYALTGAASHRRFRPYLGLRAGLLRESLDPEPGETAGDAGDSGFMGSFQGGASYRLSPGVDLELQGSFEYADLNDARTARSYVVRAGVSFFPRGRPEPGR